MADKEKLYIQTTAHLDALGLKRQEVYLVGGADENMYMHIEISSYQDIANHSYDIDKRYRVTIEEITEEIES